MLLLNIDDSKRQPIKFMEKSSRGSEKVTRSYGTLVRNWLVLEYLGYKARIYSDS